MGRRVGGQLPFVVARRNDLTAHNDECADRHVAVWNRQFGFRKCKAHEVVVLHAEKLARKSLPSPRCGNLVSTHGQRVCDFR